MHLVATRRYALEKERLRSNATQLPDSPIHRMKCRSRMSLLLSPTSRLSRPFGLRYTTTNMSIRNPLVRGHREIRYSPASCFCLMIAAWASFVRWNSVPEVVFFFFCKPRREKLAQLASGTVFVHYTELRSLTADPN